MVESIRNIEKLDGKWGFLADPERIGLKDNWEKNGLPNASQVTVPHTWNIEDVLEKYRGMGWYEYRFTASPEWNDKKIYIQFDAVYRDATVWLNGKKVGEHFNSGYTTFVLDLTSAISFNDQNLLIVSVDNSNSEEALPKGNSFDWADDGGIIRDVSFITTGEIGIDYIKIDAIPLFNEEKNNQVPGALQLNVNFFDGVNDGDQVMLEIQVERDQQVVWQDTREVRLNNGSHVLSGIHLDAVDLWHFDHPNLYELKVRVIKNNVIVDEFKDSFGFREIKTEGQKLLLNRESVRLMGVEWMPGSNPDFGMAESEEEMIRILTQLKEVNCIFTRFHWQQSKKILDWCDRNGILVQEEIPHWQSPIEPDEGTMPVSIQHAEEMVSRHYNHPCIYAWGMGNELWGQSEKTVKFMKDLKTHIRSLDQNRMVNYISNSLHYGPDKDATCVGDLLMWNEYIGTWQPSEDIHADLQGCIDSIIAANPEMPLVISEYGLCEPTFKGGDPERENILIDKTNFYRKFPSIVGAIHFSLNDYRTQMGEEGEGKLRQRVHGSTDLYGVPKPSFQALREISSPVVLGSVQRDSDSISCQVSVRNDIPSYSISGYQMIISSDEINNCGMTIEIPALLPGETTHISIPGINETVKTVNVSVVRPTGFSVLNQQMRIEKKLLI